MIQHTVHTAIDTCEWIFVHPIFLRWFDGTGILWIKGKPGSGKSTLMKSILDHLQNVSNHLNSLLVSLFVYGQGSELQKSPLGLFRSLLHQIYKESPESSNEIVEKFLRNRQTMGEPPLQWNWHDAELREYLRATLQQLCQTRSVIILVDALDELGTASALDIIYYFRGLSAMPKLRICFACRHCPILSFEEGLALSVEEQNKQDIKKVVQQKLENFSLDITTVFQKHIVERARGVFQWANIVSDKAATLLMQRRTPKYIQQSIEALPEDLNRLYADILKEKDDELGHTIRLLQWVCFSTRPLGVSELYYAMVVDSNSMSNSLTELQDDFPFDGSDAGMEAMVQQLSRGLAEISYGTVHLVHQSVYDYLLSEGFQDLDAGLAENPEGIGHLRLLKQCFKFLRVQEIEDYSNAVQRNNTLPFLEYVRLKIFYHIATAEMNGIIPGFDLSPEPLPDIPTAGARRIVLASDTLRIHVHKRAMASWNLLISKKRMGSSLVHYLACLPNIPRTFSCVVRNQAEFLDSADICGQTPLSWATECGNCETANMLISDTSVDVVSSDCTGKTPAHYAARNGHSHVMRLLRVRNPDLDLKDHLGKTPFHYAAENGHASLISFFLKEHVDVNTFNNKRIIPAYYAIIYSYYDILRFLFSKKAKIGLKDY